MQRHLLVLGLLTLSGATAFSPSAPQPLGSLKQACEPARSPTPQRLSASGLEMGLQLEGQRVLVTGAGRGIGKAISLICAKQGAKVAILSRTSEELDLVAAEGKEKFESDILTVKADVTVEEEVEKAVSEVVSKFGGVDVLVNNAGAGSAKGPSHAQSSEAFRKLLNLNVVGVHIVSSAVLRQSMLEAKKGHIINISSKAGKLGIATAMPYVASKFAVEGMTTTMALEYKDSGIRVNSISPGMVDTKSFPKAPGRPGVRTAESIEEGFLHLCAGSYTGTYFHADEFDEAKAAGKVEQAFKPIDEPKFTLS